MFAIDVFVCCSESSRSISRIYLIVMRLDIQPYPRVTNSKFEVKSESATENFNSQVLRKFQAIAPFVINLISHSPL